MPCLNDSKGIDMINKVLRLPSVSERTGLSRSTIYRKLASGQFPRRFKLGPRAVGWLEHDIEEWIQIQSALKNDVEWEGA